MKKQTVKNQDLFLGFTLVLMNHMRKCGYKITYGDAYRDPRCPYGSEKSHHHMRLAIDINLFKDGEYLSKTEDHRQFGEFWESLDERLTWGGKWNDGNHYQMF